MSIFYILIIFLFIILGTYLGYRFYKSILITKDSKFIENDEFKKKNEKINADILLFYTNWCPHCKETLKTWDTLRQINIDEDLNLNYVKIDCEKDKNTASQYDIKEYPTIILEKDGKKIVFDANLTEQSFIRFIQAVKTM